MLPPPGSSRESRAGPQGIGRTKFEYLQIACSRLRCAKRLCLALLVPKLSFGTYFAKHTLYFDSRLPSSPASSCPNSVWERTCPRNSVSLRQRWSGREGESKPSASLRSEERRVGKE